MGKVVLNKAFKFSLIPIGIASVTITICLTNLSKPLNKVEPLEIDKIPEIEEEKIEPIVILPPPAPQPPQAQPQPQPPAVSPKPADEPAPEKQDPEVPPPPDVKNQQTRTTSSAISFRDARPPEEVLIQSIRTINALNTKILSESLGDLNSLVNSVQSSLSAIKEIQKNKTTPPNTSQK